jgi:hypothetical protein
MRHALQPRFGRTGDLVPNPIAALIINVPELLVKIGFAGGRIVLGAAQQGRGICIAAIWPSSRSTAHHNVWYCLCGLRTPRATKIPALWDY